jgi:Putative prokaryotic signal transducing protein
VTDEVVYSSPTLLMVAHYRALLESHGIPGRIRNEFLAGAAGELPPTDCWPELRVAARWAPEARELISAAEAPVVDAADWTCPACGEYVERQFAVCWNCGREA